MVWKRFIGAATWRKITAFDADTKLPKWEIATSHDIGALLLFDNDLDGSLEVMYGDNQWGSIHSMNAQNQTQEWSISNPEHGVTEISVGDVNNDGILEVMWGAGATSSGSDYLYVGYTISRMIEWQNDDIDGPLSATAVGDVDDDGDTEIVMVSFESESGYADEVIHIFNGKTHEMEWQSTDLPGIYALCGSPNGPYR